MQSLQSISRLKLLISTVNKTGIVKLIKKEEENMGKKASLRVTQRAQVVALSNSKLSERQIIKTCEENETAVHNANIQKRNIQNSKKELLRMRKEQDVQGFSVAERSA